MFRVRVRSCLLRQRRAGVPRAYAPDDGDMANHAKGLGVFGADRFGSKGAALGWILTPRARRRLWRACVWQYRN